MSGRHDIQVEVSDQAGNSATYGWPVFLNNSSPLPSAQAPYPPTLNAPSVSGNSVSLSWRNNGDPAGKPVQFYCEIRDDITNTRVWPNGTIWLAGTDTGSITLPHAGSYTWSVIAANDKAQSNPVSGQPFTIGTVDYHVKITSPDDNATLSGPDVSITWDAGPGLVFDVLHGTVIRTHTSDHHYTERKVHPGTHKYTVIGYDKQGNSSSDSVTVTIPESTKIHISNHADGDTIEGATVTLKWNKDKGNDHFEVRRDGIRRSFKTTPLYDDSPVPTGKHTYVILGYDANNHPTQSDTITITVVKGPTNLNITSPTDGATGVNAPVTINWTFGSGLTDFNVRRDGEKLNGKYLVPTEGQATFSFPETSVRIGRHTYEVIGHDDGKEHRASITITATCSRWVAFTGVSGVTLPQPTVILPSGSPVTLSWTAGGGVNCFDIKHDANKIGNSVTSPFTQRGVNDGSHRYELIGSVNGGGMPYEEFIIVHVGDFHVTLTDASVSGYDVTLTWVSSKYNTGFFIKRDADSSNAWSSELLAGGDGTVGTQTFSQTLSGEPTGTHIYTIVGMETEYGLDQQDETGRDSATVTVNPTVALTLSASGTGDGNVDVNSGTQATQKLSMHGTGTGSVTLRGVKRQDAQPLIYALGDIANIDASPDINCQFDGWTGDVASSAPATSLALDSNNTSVSAAFNLNQYDLTIANSGTGQGQIKVNGTLQSLPFTGSFDHGTTVTLEAVPDGNSGFDGWSGDLTGINAQTQVSIIGSIALNAAFNPINHQPDLMLRNPYEIAFTGDGIVNANGTEQTIAQTLNPGDVGTYVFNIINRGNTSDAFVVTTAGALYGWTATYFDLATNTNITAAITSVGGWSTGNLAPGAGKGIYVQVAPTCPVQLTLLLTATSTGDSTKTDVVKAVTSRTNTAPVASPQTIWVNKGTAQALTLAGTDAEGDVLTYRVATTPAHGELTGAAPNLTYTPATGYLGADTLVFTTNDGMADSAPATVSITVVTPPIFVSIAPATAATTGGTVITIQGSGFGKAPGGLGSVDFGGATAASYASWSDTKIVCSAPAHDAGPVEVTVTAANGGTAAKVTGFTYIDPPTVLSPAGGERWVRGSKPTITWSYPGSSSKIKLELYNGATLASTISTGTANTGSFTGWTIPATVATGVTYRVRVTAVANPVATNSSAADFTIFVTPTLSTVAPITASSAGGTAITLTGTGFCTLRGAGHVTFGGVDATGYTSWTDTKIVCLAPAQTAGLVAVAVTSATGDTVTKPNALTYIVPPQVLSPNGGERWARGAKPTITWSYPGVAGKVKLELFSGTTLAATISSGTANTGSFSGWTLPATVAAGATYRVKITDIANAVATDSSDNVFTIFIPPALTTISPASTATAGGATITLNGSAFGALRGTGRVTFGGVEARSYTSWSETKIVCVAPAHLAGQVDVAVTTGAGDAVTKTKGLTFVGPAP